MTRCSCPGPPGWGWPARGPADRAATGRTSASWRRREGCAWGLPGVPSAHRGRGRLLHRARAAGPMSTVREVARDNGLSLAFGGLFLGSLVGQGLSGAADYNEQRQAQGLAAVSLGRYLTSTSFAVDVMENWQSEYLQFFLYVFATVWLVQRGSAESKEAHMVGTETDEEQRVGEHARPESPAWVRAGGWRSTLFSRSLGFVMGGIFLLTWGAMSVAGWAAYNAEQLTDHEEPVSWVGYLGHADFWNRTFQNWQSEMLAVGSMAILSVYLRQRGSPESKPVGAAHDDTGQTG